MRTTLLLLAGLAVLIANPARSRIFGENQLDLASSRVRPGEPAYRSVGRVECRSASGGLVFANAFLIGSPRLVLTDSRALGEDMARLLANGCTARFFAANGAFTITVPVTAVAPGPASSPDGHLELLVLQRAAPLPASPVTYSASTLRRASDRMPVHMVTLVSDAGGRTARARSGGHAFLPAGTPAVAVRGGGSAIIAADYDSVSANRGSAVFNQSKQVVGVHDGSRCSAPYGPVAAASATCHNDFSLFGETLRQRVAEAIRRLSA